MRLLVLSDSHGSRSFPELILKKEPACDIIVHLGDGADDLNGLMRYTARKQLWLTKGNCDPVCLGLKEKHVFTVEGVTVLACHGHPFGVKTGLDALYFEGLKEHAALCLYGHTHVAADDEYNGVRFLNPGAAGSGRYAVIDVTDGKITAALRQI